MDFQRDRLSNSKSLALNRANYSYWKVMMRIYIQSQGERVWRAVEEGWNPPFVPLTEKTLKKIRFGQKKKSKKSNSLPKP